MNNSMSHSLNNPTKATGPRTDVSRDWLTHADEHPRTGFSSGSSPEPQFDPHPSTLPHGMDVSADKSKAGDEVVARRILVVDDNHDAAMSLAMMLEIMGNETQTAHDGLEALEIAESFAPDLVMLDIGMPKLNGYETARRIRQQPWGRGMKLVALTGWGQDEDRRKSEEAGFNSHMVKPIDPTALDQLLQSR